MPADNAAISQLARIQPPGTHPMSWAVDFVLTMQAEGTAISPAIQQLVPLVRVVLWAQQIQKVPEWPEVAARWGVHRATVYRWYPELKRARKAVGK